jgi:hypothetical protein
MPDENSNIKTFSHWNLIVKKKTDRLGIELNSFVFL